MATKQKWQFIISNSILGPVLAGVRRNCRGDWMTGVEADAPPTYVMDYLGFKTENGRWVQAWEPLTLAEYRSEIMGGEGVALQRSHPNTIKGWCWIPVPTKKPKPRKIPARVPAIRNLRDLCDHFGADGPQGLNHRIYKDTECGASISLHLPDGTAIHNGDPQWDSIEVDAPIRGFTIQTIVEGSDATVDSSEFVLPVTRAEVDNWVADMEDQARELWEEANAGESETP